MRILEFGMLVLVSCVGISDSASLNDTETLHTDLLQNYNTNVRPIQDQSGAITVDITLYLKSIQEFDEVNEKFSYAASLLIRWSDYKMQWDPNQYGGLTLITVSYDDVWVPELFLSSPSSTTTAIGKSTERIRIEQNGASEWMSANLIKSTCGVSVRNYPFDTQSCDTSFTSLGYKTNEVNITAGLQTVAFDVYSPNALWDVTGSKVSTKIIGTGGESEITFTIKLKRKSSFAVINIILPILVLSLLNVLVFLLVPESGERIGYCITTLLAIAVYMTIVSDLLPQTSQPVPLIAYKLLIDMIISALIVLVTILNMRLYNKPDDCVVSDWLQSVYRRLTCARSKIYPAEEAERNLKTKSKSSSKEDRDQLQQDEKCGFENEMRDDSINSNSVSQITWKKISFMVDWLALITFTLASLTNMIVYIGMAKS